MLSVKTLTETIIEYMQRTGQGDSAGLPIIDAADAPGLAHAIAGAMKGKVMWQRDMFIRHGKAEFNFEPSDVPASYLVSDMEEIADPGSYLHLANRRIGEHGKQYRVTVEALEE